MVSAAEWWLIILVNDEIGGISEEHSNIFWEVVVGLMERFLCRRETEFAEKLAEKIQRKFPPDAGGQVGKNKRAESVVEPLLKDIDAFRAEGRPGWLGTARLGNTLRWKLIELGYSKGVAEDLTSIAIRRVMLKK